MALKKSGGYPLSPEEEPPQSLFAREARKERLERQGCVLKLVLLLCLVLTGFTAYLGYREFRVNSTRQPIDFESPDPRLESLQSGFSNLSIRQARIEDVLTRNAEEGTARLATLEMHLKMVEAALYELGAAKIERRELLETTRTLEQQMADLVETALQDVVQQEAYERQIQNISSHLEELDSNSRQQYQILADQLAEIRTGTQAAVNEFAKAMEQITKALADISRARSELTELRADLLIQTETKADKRVVDASLKKQQQTLQAQLQQQAVAMETRLRELQSQVDELKMR